MVTVFLIIRSFILNLIEGKNINPVTSPVKKPPSEQNYLQMEENQQQVK